MSDTNSEIKELAKAFEQLRGKAPLPVQLEPDAGFMLLSQLQLALRHPANRGASAESIRQFAIALQEWLVHLVPGVGPVLEKGWHPEWDVKPDESKGVREKMTYQHLALDIQEEVLANSIALNIACTTLANMTGQPPGAWIDVISERANTEVDRMSEVAVIEAVKSLDQYREQVRSAG